MAEITMEFWRDAYDGPACLEYSWVPEGLRRNIELSPGMQEGSSTDSVDDTLDASHVQAYVANNNSPSSPPPDVSLEMWQFPEGAPHTAAIVHARIELYHGGMYAIGRVRYADGYTTESRTALQPIPRRCPTGL